MRIGIISACFPPYFGWDSAAIRDFELAALLKRSGHDVEVIALTNEESRTTRQDGMLVHRVAIRGDLTALNMVPKTTPNALTALSSRSNLWHQFLEVQKTAPFDVVDVPNLLWESLMPGVFGLIPTVVRLQKEHHTYDQNSLVKQSAFEFDDDITSRLSKISLSLADAVYAPGHPSFPDTHISVSGVEQQFPECVDTDRFTISGDKAYSDNYENTVAIRTRVLDEKIHQFISKVITAVAGEHPATRFIVLAEDITSDDDEWHAQDKIKELIPEPGKVLVTRAYHELLPELIRSSPLCLVAPDCESGAYSWLEVMACGKPAIVVAPGAENSYLKDRVNAIVIQDEDSDAAAAAISTLRKDRALAEKLGSDARHFVEENFSSNQHGSRVISIYERAVNEFRTPQRTAQRASAMQQMLGEFETLIQSYDKMLYNLLFAESHRFKMKHWLNKLSDKFGSGEAK